MFLLSQSHDSVEKNECFDSRHFWKFLDCFIIFWHYFCLPLKMILMLIETEQGGYELSIIFKRTEITSLKPFLHVKLYHRNKNKKFHRGLSSSTHRDQSFIKIMDDIFLNLWSSAYHLRQSSRLWFISVASQSKLNKFSYFCFDSPQCFKSPHLMWRYLTHLLLLGGFSLKLNCYN